MRNNLSIILSILSLTMAAQTTQKGIVQEYNEKAKKTPLSGVELNVRSANSTVSDKNGAFTLTFPTLNAGARVKVRNAQKAGYEIFNKDALEQWNINPNESFNIIMCRSDKFKAICENYYSKASANYQKQLDKEKSTINKLKAEGKLKEEEYNKRLNEIQETYDMQLDNLDNYIERFARIDLSQLKAEEQEIIELVQQGLFDEAIARYDALNLKEKYRNGLDQENKEAKAIEKLQDQHKETQKANKETFASIKRNVETLELAGGKANINKAIALLQEVAEIDSLNVELLLLAGDYTKNYLADYPTALAYYNKALDVSQRLNGEYHPLTCKSNTCVGEIFIISKDFPKAMEYFNKALAEWETNGELDHQDAAQLYNDLGVVFRNTGEPDKALEYYKKALQIWQESIGQENIYVSTVLHNIGAVYTELGDYQNAQEYYLKSVNMSEKVRGPQHPTVGIAYNSIGMLSFYLGDVPKAIDYTIKARDILEKTMTADNPMIATINDNIGYYYSSIGDYGNALELYKKALEQKLKKFDEDNLNIAMSYSHIGSLYDNLEDFKSAENYLNKALQIQEKHLNPDDPDIAVSHIKLGSVYASLGEYNKSLESFKKGLEISIKNKGEDNSEVGIIFNNMAATYKGMNDFEKAFECYDKALKIYNSKLGENSLEAAKTYNNIGKSYSTLGEYGKALENINKAIEICEKAGLDPQNPIYSAFQKNKEEVESKIK